MAIPSLFKYDTDMFLRIYNNDSHYFVDVSLRKKGHNKIKSHQTGRATGGDHLEGFGGKEAADGQM